MEIDDEKLLNFLKEKESKLQKRSFPFDGIFAAITFLFALLTVDYNKIENLSNPIIVAIFWFLFLAYLGYQIYRIIMFIKKTSYTVDNLYNDIKNLNKGPSKFSLIIIKDCVSDNKNRILLQYDKRWKCYLLPYVRTKEDYDENIKAVKSSVSNRLNISDSAIDTKLVKKESPVTKFSVSNDRTKNYIHRFYTASISITNKIIMRRFFIINGEKYRWFSIDEMYRNKAMKKKNQDIIDEINELNIFAN